MYTASDSIEAYNQQQQIRMVMGLMPNNVSAEAMAGGAMSRGGATMGPLMSGAAGMLGLDPLTMGLKAGMGAYSSGMVGIAGAAGIGMGVAGAAGVGALAAGYAGNQMMHGAQQQMMLNQGLRQNYNFMNANGGMGFSSNQGFQIGNALRGMTGQTGPSGEIAGFSELSKLASNMGQMGMGGQNVRTVEEFKSKFKELLDATKKVAHDLGSTLEDAMKTMAAMKNSGVFRAIDQAKMSGVIRQTALNGNIATSEVTSMASIGSQISRSVGGTAIAGANAGMSAIGHIGSAVQRGVLSEEDIFAVTGLTGADGRQAMAASQLQHSAAYLRGGRGRRFLASVAGKDGALNEEAASEWMSGGNMSTGRTMQLAHQNLSEIGRANFIRNEGRLRGAALERFGGANIDAMNHAQWLQSRGFDINNMSDRNMIAFQRFTHQDREGAEASLKLVRDLPEQLRSQNETSRGLSRADAMQRQRATTGIEGLKHKVEHMKEEVNNVFETAGGKVLANVQERLEGWFNEIQGVYVSSSTQGVSEMLKSMERSVSGGSSSRDFRRMFGKAGGGGPSSVQFANKQQNDLLMAARQGSTNSGVMAYAGANEESIKLATLASLGKSGDEAVSAFRAALDPTGQALFNSANRLDQAGIMQGMQQAGGVATGSQLATLLSKQQQGVDMGGGSRTEAGAQRALGNMARGRDAAYQADKERSQAWGAVFGAVAATSTFGISTLIGTSAEGFGAQSSFGIQGLMRGMGLMRDKDDDYTQAAGALFQDKKYLGMFSDLSQGSASERKAARGQVMDEVLALQSSAANGKLAAGDQVKVDMLMAASIGSEDSTADLLKRAAAGEKVDLSGAIKKYRAGTKSTDSDEEIIKRLQAGVTGSAAAAEAKQQENLRAATDEARSNQDALRKSAQESGRATMERDENGRLTGRLTAVSKGNDVTDLVAQDVLNRQLNVDMSGPGGLRNYVDARQTGNLDIASLTMAQRKQLTMQHAGDIVGDMAATSVAQEQRFNASRKRGGSNAGAVLDMMGMDLTKDERAALKKMNAGQQENYVMDKLQLNADQAMELHGALATNNSGEKAARLSDMVNNLDPNSAAGKALAERREGQRDPQEKLLEKIQESALKQTKVLELIAKHSGATAEEIKNLGNKEDPEKK